MIEQIALSYEAAKTVVAILESSAPTWRVWDDVYEIFHDGRNIGHNQERTITLVTRNESSRVTLADDDELEPINFGLYDSSTNTYTGVTRAEFLDIMKTYVSSFSKVHTKKETDSQLEQRVEQLETELRAIKTLLGRQGIIC